MKKLLTVFGLSAAATLALGGAAEAAYPPGGPGSISIADPVCNYSASGELESWSVTFDVTVTAEDGWMTVINPISDDILMSSQTTIGTHTLTIDNNYPGVNSTPPMNGNIVVNLGQSDMLVTEESAGCLAVLDGGDGDVGDDDQTDLPDDALTIVQPECRLEDPDDPTSPIVNWSFRVDLDVPEAGQLWIIGSDGNIYLEQMVPAGETSILIDSSYEMFSHLMAPYQPYTVSWLGSDTGRDLSMNTRACDPPYDPQALMAVLEPSCTYDEATGALTDWSFKVDGYSQARPAAIVVTSNRDSVGETYAFQTQEQHLTINGDGAFSGPTAGFDTYTVRLVFDGRVLDEETVIPCPVVDVGGPTTQVDNTTRTLPKTGLSAGGLAILALVLSGSGGGLLWAARRRGASLF